MASLKENIAQAIADFDSIKTAIEEKGVTVGNVPTSQYADKIGQISSGGETSGDGEVGGEGQIGGGEDNKFWLIKNSRGVNENYPVGVLGFNGYRGYNTAISILSDTTYQEVHIRSAVEKRTYTKLIARVTVVSNVTSNVLLHIVSEPVTGNIVSGGTMAADKIIKSTSISVPLQSSSGAVYGLCDLLELDLTDVDTEFYPCVQIKQSWGTVSDMWLE